MSRAFPRPAWGLQRPKSEVVPSARSSIDWSILPKRDARAVCSGRTPPGVRPSLLCASAKRRATRVARECPETQCVRAFAARDNCARKPLVPHGCGAMCGEKTGSGGPVSAALRRQQGAAGDSRCCHLLPVGARSTAECGIRMPPSPAPRQTSAPSEPLLATVKATRNANMRSGIRTHPRSARHRTALDPRHPERRSHSRGDGESV